MWQTGRTSDENTNIQRVGAEEAHHTTKPYKGMLLRMTPSKLINRLGFRVVGHEGYGLCQMEAVWEQNIVASIN